MRSLSIFILLLSLVLCSLLWFALQQYAGFTLPLPWPDEVVFFFGGKNFAEHYSFIVPELNPDRVLRWFPPGFSVFFGLLEKVFSDGSYVNGRILIGSLMLEAFLMLGVFCWRLQMRYVSIFLCICVLFSMHTVIAGNIIRPEAVVLFLFASGLALLAWRNELLAISLFLLIPFVHPVSCFAVIPVIVVSAFYMRDARVVSNWWKWFLLGSVLSCYSVFALDTFRNFLDASSDYNHQINGRDFSLLEIAIKQVNNWVALVSGVLLLVGGVVRKQRLVVILASAAIGFLLIRIVGQGFWYGIYRRVAILLVCVGFIEFMSMAYLKYFNRRWIGAFNLFSAFCIGLAMFLVGAIDPFYKNWSWEGMNVMEKGQAYLAPADLNRVRHELDSISRFAQPGYIMFYPSGDMCFYSNLLPNGQKPIMPVFVQPEPSMVLYHNSKYHTDAVRAEGLEWMRQYLPYIHYVHAFTTQSGNSFTVFVLRGRPKLIMDASAKLPNSELLPYSQ